MTTTTKKDNFTSLVGVKWTYERMIKVHSDMFASYTDAIIETKKFTKKEKIKRYDEAYKWIVRIINLCENKDLAIKKKK